MNQQWLIDHVLETRGSLPKVPSTDAEYLSLAEAEKIVDNTLEYLGSHGESGEYTYLRGHRTRLMHTLTMIPKADGDRTRLLDIGCYGYMALWARLHLGYEQVEGIEWLPDSKESVHRRELRVWDQQIQFNSYNFDITKSEWPVDDEYDTILFFEVLEHVNEDPMGVMERIQQRLLYGGSLIMSVPNSVSYKSLKEFLVGMPPWTYWFYEPDLSHEPRHCFEYTPIVFQSLLIAAGFNIEAFRTIYAYSKPEHEQDTLEIASALGFDRQDLGETMIANTTKTRTDIPLRHPDVLYSPDGYYKNVYPKLQEVFTEKLTQIRALTGKMNMDSSEPDSVSQPEDNDDRIQDLINTCEAQLRKQKSLESELADSKSSYERLALDRDAQRAWANDLATENKTLQTQINDLLFQSDLRLQREQELRKLSDQAVSQSSELKQTSSLLSEENAELRSQVNQLLFACDCYLQQINDPDRCVQVIRQRRFRYTLDRSKAIARKTPIVRTALRPVYRSAKKYIKRRRK